MGQIQTSIKPHYITATTIPDAWFRLNELCYNEGREYTIEEGSYIGQKRRELDFVVCHILHPSSRPLLPETPQGIPDPVDGGIEFIENNYLRTIMTPDLEENEVYSYGNRLFNEYYTILNSTQHGCITFEYFVQVQEVIDKFKRGFNNNQCCLSISRPEDIILEDPPCLRSIDCRIFEDEKKLHFYIYFRSWDCFNGLPANLAAFVYLQEYMCDEIGKGVTPGEFVCMSKGLHTYDHTWSVLRDYLGTK